MEIKGDLGIDAHTHVVVHQTLLNATKMAQMMGPFGRHFPPAQTSHELTFNQSLKQWGVKCWFKMFDGGWLPV